jgi:hypothetical protein
MIQIQLDQQLLRENCQIHLMTREDYDRERGRRINRVVPINIPLPPFRMNLSPNCVNCSSLGIVIKCVNSIISNKCWGNHAILQNIRIDFQQQTNFVPGDILYKIGGYETSSLSIEELRQKLALITNRNDCHFIKFVNYERIKKRMNDFGIIKQFWNYENPCKYCGCIHLKTKVKNKKSQCCSNGEYLNPNLLPDIGVLPSELAHLTYDRIDHMSSKSSYYNGVLALGATGVDNGTGGGWEKIIGDHAVKLHGRTFHFLPSTGGCGGLEYFYLIGIFYIQCSRLINDSC